MKTRALKTRPSSLEPHTCESGKVRTTVIVFVVLTLFVFAGQLVARTSTGSESIGGHAPVEAATQPLQVSFTINPSSTPAGYPISFNATVIGGTGPDIYNWTFGDLSSLASGSLVTHAFTSLGTFGITLNVTDSTGAFAWAKQIITVTKYYAAWTPSFTSTPATLFAGAQAFFDASGSADPNGPLVSYSWNMGDGTLDNGIGVLHIYSAPGVYEVTLAASDNTGIIQEKQLAVWIHPSLTLIVAANATQGSAPLFITFSANATGGQQPYSYSWDFGDGLTSNRPSPLHNYTIARAYRVQLTVTDALGHTASQFMTITAVALPIEPSFLGVSDATLKIGGVLTAVSMFPLM